MTTHPAEVNAEPAVWPGHYRCFVCGERAAIRVFSGTYSCGGWPGCVAHEQAAIDRALAPLTSSTLVAGYAVRAYRVEVDELGEPKTSHRPLWTARPRTAATKVTTP